MMSRFPLSRYNAAKISHFGYSAGVFDESRHPRDQAGKFAPIGSHAEQHSDATQTSQQGGATKVLDQDQFRLNKIREAVHARLAASHPGKVESVVGYLSSRKRVDIIDLADKHGLTVGQAKQVNEAVKELLRESLGGGSKPLTQAQRIGRYLSQKQIGPIRRR